MQTLSKTKGIGGSIKTSAEDFLVREITKDCTVLELGKRYERIGEAGGKFSTIVLQKSNWSTQEAATAVAKRLGRGRKSVGYAGMKDRIATTVQLISIYGVSPEAVKSVNVKDISINGAWSSTAGIKIGDLVGNNFTIKVVGAKGIEEIEKTAAELNGIMPNYFDRQRFGTRMNNHIVGIDILKGDFEAAAMEILTATASETSEAAIAARKRLREERDFGKALEYFPKYLKHERAMLDYLHRYPGNFANAIRKIPRGIGLVFVHAVEDYIFNAALEKMVKDGITLESASGLRCGTNEYKFPDISSVGASGDFPVLNLIGYESDDKHISDYEKEVMLGLGIAKEDFKIKGMPELSMKGSYRPCFAPFKDFSFTANGTEANFSFSLPAGSYATLLINEFTKADDFKLEGIASEQIA
ncbi:MAG: tRNA pseudouridine(13) synthase TruD [Candidatus Micrarchaeia archaeon]